MKDCEAKKITIKTDGESCYYSIFGDLTKYYDLQNLKFNHPEMKNHINENKEMLESLLLRQQELINFSSEN